MKKFHSLTSKVFAYVLAASICVLSFAGCNSKTSTSSATAKGPVTISFWNSFTGSDGDTLKKLVDQFNTEYQGKIKIDMNILSADAFTQKLPPAIATKTAPDLVTLSSISMNSYTGKIMELSDFFNKGYADKSNFEDAALSLGQLDGKQYGIPGEVFATYMYWNKDLFKAAGLDPDKPPQNFDELKQDAIKLTIPSKKQYGLGLCASAAPQWYSIFIRGNGGNVIDSTGKKSDLNSNTNIATFNYIHDLEYKYNVTPKSTGGVDMDNDMQSGKIGIYFDGPWLVPGLVSHNVNYGIALIPTGTKKQSTVLDGQLFCVPVGTDPSHLDAIYTFLKFWNSDSIAKTWAMAIGDPPYLKSVINDSEVKANQNIKVFSSAMDGIAQPWNLGISGADKIDNDVLFPLVEKLQTDTDVNAAVKAASDSIDKQLSGN